MLSIFSAGSESVFVLLLHLYFLWKNVGYLFWPIDPFFGKKKSWTTNTKCTVWPKLMKNKRFKTYLDSYMCAEMNMYEIVHEACLKPLSKRFRNTRVHVFKS